MSGAVSRDDGKKVVDRPKYLVHYAHMSQTHRPNAKIPEKCPSCDGGLVVTRLECPDCGTEVSGRFESRPVSRLAPDDEDFVFYFVRNKGNLKEMERELGGSYWTMRRRLDQIVEQLDLEKSEGKETRRFEIRRVSPERAREVIRSIREQPTAATPEATGEAAAQDASGASPEPSQATDLQEQA
jgi:hypothetical protein